MVSKNKEAAKSEIPLSISDDQIVTERQLPRRSFLNRTGAVLAGAAGIVAGMRVSASPQQSDPDQKKASDPDQRKASDPDQKRASDPDQKKASDPDQKRASDPDQKKGSDPDKGKERY